MHYEENVCSGQALSCFSGPVVQDIHKGDGLKNPINRVYSTNAAEPWHVDDADVVGKPITLVAHIHDLG